MRCRESLSVRARSILPHYIDPPCIAWRTKGALVICLTPAPRPHPFCASQTLHSLELDPVVRQNYASQDMLSVLLRTSAFAVMLVNL